jgi:[acyl-carrier-protein] S-malonyltransferase
MCREVRRSSGALVTIAGVNGPQQVVVGGTERGLELVEAEARRRAARAVRLNISIPAHTPLMAAASRAMRDALDRVRFSTPSVPLVSAVSGAILSSGDDVRRALQRQMLRPVHWPRVVAALEASQAVPWDVGPGEVIAGITSRFGLRVQSLWRWLQDRAADLQEAVPAVVRP